MVWNTWGVVSSMALEKLEELFNWKNTLNHSGEPQGVVYSSGHW